MSTLVAEMIVEAYDTDATGARADAAAIEMARLIEVRSVPPPPGPEPAPDLDLDELPAFRPRRRTVAIGVGIVASLIAAASVAAFLLAR